MQIVEISNTAACCFLTDASFVADLAFWGRFWILDGHLLGFVFWGAVFEECTRSGAADAHPLDGRNTTDARMSQA